MDNADSTLLVQTPSAREESRNKYALLSLLFLLVLSIVIVLVQGASSTTTNGDVYLMEYYVLEDVEAMCNDGSPPAFFYYPGDPDSTEWIVLLEGHESCSDDVSCLERIDKFGMGSITTYGDTGIKDISMFGILSPDPEINPLYNHRNMVFPRYCSSDSWVGNAKSGEDGNDSEYHFMGSAILDSILAELSANFGMAAATSIFFTGEASMGNMGAFLNQDRVQRDLAPTLFPNAQLTGITDLGWFVEYPCFDGRNSSVCGPIPTLQDGVAAWNPILPTYCDTFLTDGEGWKCWYPIEIDLDLIETPTFHFVNVYDWGYLWGLAVEGPADDSNLDYIEAYAQEIRDTLLASGVACYLPDCSEHGVVASESWSTLLVRGITPMDAFTEYYLNNSYMGVGDDTYHTFNGNPTCMEDWYDQI